MLNDTLKLQIKNHALKESPRECGGLISYRNGNVVITECENQSVNDHRFVIDLIDYLKATKLGKIIACYHSHIENEQFSEFDKMNSNLHRLKYILYCIKTGTFLEYEPNNYVFSYIGKPFEIGK